MPDIIRGNSAPFQVPPVISPSGGSKSIQTRKVCRAFQAPKAPLGKILPYVSPDPTPELQNLDDFQALRADRYRVQKVIRKLILDAAGWDASDPDFELYNSLLRVVKCRRSVAGLSASLMLNHGTGKAFMSGLVVCGSPWSCPVCAVQIQEKRRKEIAEGIDWAYSAGFKVVMVTFTTPHYAFQTCADLLERFTAASRWMRGGKVWSQWRQSIGLQGTIRGLETLHGLNGWHTHTHELFIVSPEVSGENIRAFISARWEAACRRFKLIPRGKLREFRKRAVNVQDNARCSDYLAKSANVENLRWGADREITKSFSKGRKKSLHPFQLADLAGSGNQEAGELFLEYLNAFKGRCAVFWSKGLKKKAGVGDVSDKEAAEDSAAGSEVEPEELLKVEHHAVRAVVGDNGIPKLLAAGENGGALAAEEYLRSLGVGSVTATYFSELKNIRAGLP